MKSTAMQSVGFKVIVGLAFVWLGLFAPLSKATTEAAAQSIPVAVKQAVNEAHLVGKGMLRLFGFRVYEARLFAGPNFSIKEGWDKQSFALELIYARSVSGKAISQSSRDELARLKTGNDAKRAAWAISMDGLFVDVKEGDRIVGIYKPNQATKFLLNDKPLGVIQDPEFGLAFFGIWLNEETKDKDLRAALLGAAGNKKAGQPHGR